MQMAGARPGGGTATTSLYPDDNKPAIKPVYLWFIPGLNYQKEHSYHDGKRITRYNATRQYQ